LASFVPSSILTVSDLSKIGPFLSGIALLLGAAAAWATFILFHRRTLREQWVDNFRQIYAEFWKDPEISEVRRWIASDKEYEALARVLRERLEHSSNRLDKEANQKLELLDKFMALLFRVASFNKDKMDKDQRALWSQMFETFWLKRTHTRPELTEYMRKYWPHLHSQTKTAAKDDSSEIGQ
jgi:hypothetical protein